MLIPKHQRPKLHDADEPAKVHDLLIRVTAVQHAGKVEELGALVNLGPKSVLDSLFGISESGGLADEVQVGQDADDFRESVGLEDVDKLEGFLSNGKAPRSGTCSHTTTPHDESLVSPSQTQSSRQSSSTPNPPLFLHRSSTRDRSRTR
jgi:hypothetical protein